MPFCPAGFEGAKFLIEGGGGGGVFPCLPNVGREFGWEVIGELVAEAFAEGFSCDIIGG